MSFLMSAFIQPLRLVRQSLHTAVQTMPLAGGSLVQPETVSLTAVRTKVRCYFPRPNEVKRVRRHGWLARISTHNGRKIIMRRLLKGRHVLTH